MKNIITGLVLVFSIANLTYSQHLLFDQVSIGQNPLLESKQYVEAGLYQKAQWMLEDYLRTLPQFEQTEDALFLLTRCYIEQQKYEDAYQSSEELFRQKVSGFRNIGANYYRGISAYHTSRFQSAVKSFQNIIKTDNALKGEAYYWKALSELELGNLKNAENDIFSSYNLISPEKNNLSDKILKKDDILFLWGEVNDKSGDFKAAISRFEKLSQDFPESPLKINSNIRLASLFIRLNQNGKAIEILNKIKPVNPKQKNDWLFLYAEAEYSIGAYLNSKTKYQELIKTFPQGIHTRNAKYGLAWCNLKIKNYQEAIGYFKEISLGNDTLAQNSLFQIGAISYLTENHAGAIEAFDELVGKFPYNDYADDAYFYIGLIRYNQKQYSDARRNFQIAAKLFPNSGFRAEAFLLLGEASIVFGDLAYAQYAFSQVQKLPAHDTLITSAIMQEGIVLYHLGRFNSSDEKFSEFIRKFGRHKLVADAFFWKGEALYQSSKFSDAEQSYSSAIKAMKKDHQKRIDALYGLSWAYFEQKKFKQAITAFDNFIAENPKMEKNIEANLRKADCFFFLREFDKATQLYTSLAEGKKDSRLAEYAAFQLGLSYIQRGDISRGVEHMRRFLQKYPASSYSEVAQFNIAWAYYSVEQFTKAIAEFTVFEGWYSQSLLMPRVLLNKGDSYYNIGEYDDARAYYKRIIEEYPTSLLKPDAINGLQFTYQAQGKSADAVAAIDALISKQSESGGNDELLLRKGDILFGQGNFGLAAIEYLKILHLQSNPATKSKALFQLGRAFEFENNIPTSIDYFSRIQLEFPESEIAPGALLSIGYLYLKQKLWQQALINFNSIEERYSTSPLVYEAQYNAGVAYINMKDAESARSVFRKVIQNAPAEEIFAHRSRLQIARMLQTKKQYNEAIDTLNVILTILSDDIAAEALLLIGENFLSLKKPADALNSFNQVVEAFPHYPVLVERAWLGSGECFERLKDRAKARNAYSQIINNPIDPVIKKDAEERLRRLK